MPGSQHKSQEARILEILLRAGAAWVPAPELADVALQYAARIHTIRKKLGLKVENRLETGPDGVKRGYYRLARGVPATIRHPAQPAASGALFTLGELERGAAPSTFPEPMSALERGRMRRHRERQ